MPKMNIRSVFIIMALVCSICIWMGCETMDAVDPSKEIEVLNAPKDMRSLSVSEVFEDIDPGQYMACRIYDSTTMKYLEDCEVAIVSPQGSTRTYYLPVGKFQLKNLTLGKYKIRVNKDGYTRQYKAVEVVPKECNECTCYYLVNFYLVPVSSSYKIGPEGGVISLDDLAEIKIPAGALKTLTNISMTFMQPFEMSGLPDTDWGLDPDLHTIGGLDLRPSELIFDSPVTVTFFLKSDLLINDATAWIYLFDSNSERWITPVEVQFNETQTQATVEITHFSMFGLFTNKKDVKVEIQLFKDGARFDPEPPDWRVLRVSKCNESACACLVDLSIFYEGDPNYEEVALEMVEEKIASHEIEIIEDYCFECECIVRIGYKVTLEYRIKYRIYDVVIYDQPGQNKEVGKVLVPERVDFRCIYDECHDQGGTITN